MLDTEYLCYSQHFYLYEKKHQIFCQESLLRGIYDDLYFLKAHKKRI